jgi:glycine betaine/proline transport system ATP-binding protein
MKDGKPVGVLDMRKLVRALVPSVQSENPQSARTGV